MYWTNKPQFFGVRAMASNVSTGTGTYTAEMFQQDFPQFFNADGECLVPETILTMFINRANNAITPDKWGDAWQYAAGLYVAHFSTMYLSTYAPSSDTAAQAAATGGLVGVIKSATLGDSSVTYDTDTLTKATAEWGSLNATKYGQMLATEARLVGMGGTYVI